LTLPNSANDLKRKLKSKMDYLNLMTELSLLEMTREKLLEKEEINKIAKIEKSQINYEKKVELKKIELSEVELN
jgi:hypothetical protein